MPNERPVTIQELVKYPATLKILLALLDCDSSNQWGLTRMTGAHSRTLDKALAILSKGGMIRIANPKFKPKNVKDYYTLTAHGRIVANSLLEVTRCVDRSK